MKHILRSLSILPLLLALFGCSHLLVAGQSDAKDRESRNPQGVWRTTVTPRICATGSPIGPIFPGILLFADEGTMTGTSTAAASVYGTWERASGHRQYSFATISLRFDPAGNLIGFRRISQNFTMDDSGNAFSSSGGFQDSDINGNPVATGCSTAVGTRFE